MGTDGNTGSEMGVILDAQMETRPSGDGLKLRITDPASAAEVEVFVPETPEGATAVMAISEKMFELVSYAMNLLAAEGNEEG